MKINTYIPELSYLFPFVALMARKSDDRDANPSDGNDYIEDTLRKKLGDEFIKFDRVQCGVDWSGVVELREKIIIAHLGTEGGLFGKAWMSNIFGAFRTIDGIHSGFYNAGKDTFNAIQSKTFAYSRTDKEVVQVTHSRGVRGKIAAQFSAHQLLFDKNIPTYCFSPPPCFTKNGESVYNSYGIATINIFNPNDPVDNVGLFALKHGGNHVVLPDSGRMAGNIPLFPHGYEDIMWNIAKYCLNNEQVRDYDRLLEWIGVCTV